jgi:hypothetical protein
MLAVCLMALAMPLVRPYWTGPGLQTSASLVMLQGTEPVPLDGEAPIEITAGDTRQVTFQFHDLPRGETPDFVNPAVPDGIQIEPLPAASLPAAHTFRLTVTDLNLPEGPLPAITFRATLPNQKPFEKQLTFHVRRPAGWLPEKLAKHGFREASDSRLCRVGNVIYATILERPVAATSARFRLVPETIVDDRHVRTFYAMEQPVSNAQFHEFTKAQPDFELSPRQPDERGWTTADGAPVTDIYVLEAQRFAHWLADDYGSLPTTTEWELAAGYHDFIRLAAEQFQRDPLEIDSDSLNSLSLLRETVPVIGAEAWVGPGPMLGEFRDVNGTTVKECSPYGCRFGRLESGVMLTEMTATVTEYLKKLELRELCRKGIPTQDDPILSSHRYAANLRGPGSDIADNHRLWLATDGDQLRVAQISDLDITATSLTLHPDGISRALYVGFRVVLSTDQVDE